MGWVGAGIEVVAGSSVRDKERGAGHVSEDVGALPECEAID